MDRDDPSLFVHPRAREPFGWTELGFICANFFFLRKPSWLPVQDNGLAAASDLITAFGLREGQRRCFLNGWKLYLEEWRRDHLPPAFIEGETMTRFFVRRKELQAIHQTLIFPLPALPSECDASAYVYLVRGAQPVPAQVQVVQGCWWVSPLPLALEQILHARLVPVSRAARVTCGRMVFGSPQGDVNQPMIWQAYDRDAAEFVAWYPATQVWGSSFYSTRGGKEGTTFARTCEPLIAQALADGLLPRPDVAPEPIRQLFHLERVEPVALAIGQTPLGRCLQEQGVQGLSECTPRFSLPTQVPEWLVSVLYEQRQMALLVPQATFPSLEAVFFYLFALRQQIVLTPQAQDWPRIWGEEHPPYDVCARWVAAWEETLGADTLALIEQAFVTTLREGHACVQAGESVSV